MEPDTMPPSTTTTVTTIAAAAIVATFSPVWPWSLWSFVMVMGCVRKGGEVKCFGHCCPITGRREPKGEKVKIKTYLDDSGAAAKSLIVPGEEVY
jgi:hypothetical protein